MKLLVVFLLAVLGCSLAEAKLVPKCELRDQLKTAIGNLMMKAQPQGITVDNLVARNMITTVWDQGGVVCQAEMASGFNTSAMKEMIPRKEDLGHHGGYSGHDQPHSRRQRHDHRPSPQSKPPPKPGNHGGHSGRDQPHSRGRRHDHRPSSQTTAPLQLRNHGGHSGHDQPHSRGRRHDHRPSSQTKPFPQLRNHGGHSGPDQPPSQGQQPSSEASSPSQPCTLYGVFQLASHLACDDGVTPSANICGIPCSNLLNDDLSDDISCLLEVPSSLGMAPMLAKKCEDVKASVYFAGCSPS